MRHLPSTMGNEGVRRLRAQPRLMSLVFLLVISVRSQNSGNPNVRCFDVNSQRSQFPMSQSQMQPPQQSQRLQAPPQSQQSGPVSFGGNANSGQQRFEPTFQGQAPPGPQLAQLQRPPGPTQPPPPPPSPPRMSVPAATSTSGGGRCTCQCEPLRVEVPRVQVKYIPVPVHANGNNGNNNNNYNNQQPSPSMVGRPMKADRPNNTPLNGNAPLNPSGVFEDANFSDNTGGTTFSSSSRKTSSSSSAAFDAMDREISQKQFLIETQEDILDDRPTEAFPFKPNGYGVKYSGR